MPLPLKGAMGDELLWLRTKVWTTQNLESHPPAHSARFPSANRRRDFILFSDPEGRGIKPLMIKDLETAVKKLPEQEFRKFREWLASYDAEIWDKKFEKDSAAGKLDKISSEAINDFKKGNYREI
ncbi:hypothetical protein BH23BAC3_BH23BAC3_31220 [soil metagenome]